MTTNPAQRPGTVRLKCGTCKQWFEAPQNAKYLPFCSPRCQWIDLHGWINEEYGLPWEGDSTERQAAMEQQRQDED